MIIRYLKSDIKGAYSRLLYGRQGEMVTILQNNINLLLVVNKTGDKYYVKPEQLSDVPVKNEEDELLSMQSQSTRNKVRLKSNRNRQNM